MDQDRLKRGNGRLWLFPNTYKNAYAAGPGQTLHDGLSMDRNLCFEKTSKDKATVSLLCSSCKLQSLPHTETCTIDETSIEW